MSKFRHNLFYFIVDIVDSDYVEEEVDVMGTFVYSEFLCNLPKT